MGPYRGLYALYRGLYGFIYGDSMELCKGLNKV